LQLPDYPDEVDALTLLHNTELQRIQEKLKTRKLSLSKRLRLAGRASQLETILDDLAKHRKGVADRESFLPHLPGLVSTYA
jgi:hypothetical protein